MNGEKIDGDVVSDAEWMTAEFEGTSFPIGRCLAVAKELGLPEVTVVSFVSSWREVADKLYGINVANGFWDEPRNKSEAIMLMVTEEAEAVEALRHGDPPDDKLTHEKGSIVELMDGVIRKMDYIAGFEPEAWPALILLEKVAFNANRPKKHGKEF